MQVRKSTRMTFAPSAPRNGRIGAGEVVLTGYLGGTNPYARSGNVSTSQSVPRLPVILQAAKKDRMRQVHAIDCLSFPSLQNRDRVRNLREQKERNEKRAKAKSKEDRVQAKKRRIKDRKSRRRQIKADKVAAELAHAAGKHAAARTIQRLVRGKQGWALLMRTLRAHRAIISLQSIVRGYIGWFAEWRIY